MTQFNPPKFITGYITNIQDFEAWTESAPKLWEGMAFRWTVDLNVSPQAHGSDATATPFQYDGFDIKVGDWIHDTIGNTFKVYRVDLAGTYNATVILEDVDQYNTYRDPYISGYGGPQIGSCGIFSLSADGSPILEGLPSNTFADNITSNIVGRFNNRNIKTDFVQVEQTNHGFEVGDFICVDADNEGRFELVPVTSANLAIGVVSQVFGPTMGHFNYRPLGKLMDDIQPALVGNYGDVFYLDPQNPGKLTNVRPTRNAKPVYIRLDSETRGFLLNVSVDEDTITVSYKVETVTLDQVTFTLPSNAAVVQSMSINGIENKNFTFDTTTKVLTFDPVATGYGVEETDEVIFVYNT